MAEFIEVTRFDGEKIIVGTDHIVEIIPDTEGSVIFYDIVTGNNGNISQNRVHIKEKYAIIRHKLGL